MADSYSGFEMVGDDAPAKTLHSLQELTASVGQSTAALLNPYAAIACNLISALVIKESLQNPLDVTVHFLNSSIVKASLDLAKNKVKESIVTKNAKELFPGYTDIKWAFQIYSLENLYFEQGMLEGKKIYNAYWDMAHHELHSHLMRLMLAGGGLYQAGEGNDFKPYMNNDYGFSISFKNRKGKAHTCGLFKIVNGWCFFNSKSHEKHHFRGSALLARDCSSYPMLLDRIFSLTKVYDCDTVHINAWYCPSLAIEDDWEMLD